MILAIDIGNTTVGFYVADKENNQIEVRSSFTLPTDAAWTVQRYEEEIRQAMSQKACEPDFVRQVDSIILSSVVPAVSTLVKRAVEAVFQMEAEELSNRDNRLLQLQVKEPDKVGFDRIADATWAAENYPLPVVTVDMGTATTFNVVDEHRNFLGGVIAPGILTGLEALSHKAAKLPEIPVEAPAHVIGRDTVECMQSGAVFGAAAMVDGMLARIEEALGREVTVVMTGGGAKIVHPLCRHAHIYEPQLLIKGLILMKLNQKTIES